MNTQLRAKWSLDRAAFEGLLRRLAPEADTAAAEYEAIRRRLIEFFQGRGSTWPEAQADAAHPQHTEGRGRVYHQRQ